MKSKILLLLLPFILLSCVTILKKTVGKVIHTKSEKQFQFDTSDIIEFGYSIESGIIVLRFSFNKVDTLRFIFDSGANTCITENTAIRLEGALTNKTKSSLDGNSISTTGKVYFFDSVQFNNITLYNLRIHSFENIPLNADGIIGRDFMANKIISVNSFTKKITFSNRKLIKTNSKPIKMKKGWDGRYYVSAKIENKNFNLLFDTGYNGSIFIKDTVKFRSQKEASYLSKSINMHSQSFRITDLYDVPFVIIGDYKFENEKISVYQEYGLKNDYGLLGFSLFLNQDVTLDFIEGKIYFDKLNLGSKVNYFPPINFYYNNGLRILNLEPDVFNETGILPDDEIYAINRYRVPQGKDEITDFFLKREYRIYKDSLELEILRGDSSFVRKIKWKYLD